MTVLVTGAFGLVGSATVRQLKTDGRDVVASDIDNEKNRKAAAALDVPTRWADLTDRESVTRLIADTAPEAVIHLAAVIPPACYVNPRVARKVNVEAALVLIEVVSAAPLQPRMVLASSIATYGPRNPFQHPGPLTADTPQTPYDIYGAHKVEVEQALRASDLDWLILRLGGVLTVAPRGVATVDGVFLEAALPVDNRLHTVDVRDVARAFAAATTVPAGGEALLIAGDDSHRQRQGAVSREIGAAIGLRDGFPAGRTGDPASSLDWFCTDWMDTARAQELLNFQRHSWPDMLGEMTEAMGWKRHLLRPAAPLTRTWLQRRSPYRGMPGFYADPWGAVTRRWGNPRAAAERP